MLISDLKKKKNEKQPLKEHIESLLTCSLVIQGGATTLTPYSLPALAFVNTVLCSIISHSFDLIHLSFLGLHSLRTHRSFHSDVNNVKGVGVGTVLRNLSLKVN